MFDIQNKAAAAYKIVADAGGQIVGRTRIQKAAYFLEEMGLGSGFEFSYRHYGPFSEDLSSALHYAKILGNVEEEEKRAAWGGWYTVFNAQAHAPQDDPRVQVLQVLREADAVALELAATALFLWKQGTADPWHETAKRKPDKAESIDDAKELYNSIRDLNVGEPLPAI